MLANLKTNVFSYTTFVLNIFLFNMVRTSLKQVYGMANIYLLGKVDLAI